MTKTIWKHDITGAYGKKEGVTIQLPVGAKVLHAGAQHGGFFIWEEHDTVNDENLEERTFNIYGTGWEFESKEVQAYISTIFAGPFVWHVYEEE